MALVSDSIVDQWYKRDSWVYKNFAYLFVNSFWQKKIPSGYSLCPYFWVSMFSLCIFRPIIIPFMYMIKGIVYFLSPIKGVFKYTDKFLEDNFDMNQRRPGINTVVVSVLSSAGLFVLYHLTTIGFHVAKELFTMFNEADALIVLFGVPAILISFFVCLQYIHKHYYDSDRCKVEYYNHVITLVTFALAIFLMPGEFVWVLKESVHVAVSPFILIWSLLSFLFSYAASIGLYILYGMVIGGFISILGYIMYKIGDKMAFEPEKPAPAKDYTKFWHGMKSEKDFLVYSRYDFGYSTDPDTMYEFIRCGSYSDIIAKYYAEEIDFDTFAKEMGKEYRKYFDNKYAIMRKNMQAREEKCKKLSNAISKVIAPMVWPIKQSAIFFSMLKEVWKARKQGFCPYKKFTD